MSRGRQATSTLIGRFLGRALPYTLLACWLAVPPAPAGAAEAPQKRVLLLYTARRDAPGTSAVEKTLQKSLNDGLAGGLDYYNEYVDVASFPEQSYQSALRDFLRRKYARNQFDLIVTVGGTSLNFIVRYGAELFPGVPVVFLGPGAHTVRGLRLGPNFTGQVERLDLLGSVDVALRLQPRTRRVFVVSGASESDRFYETLARQQLREFEGRVELIYLAGLPLKELLKTAASLPADSVIYYLMITGDRDGNRFLPQEVLTKLLAAANAPIYGFTDLHLDYGAFGGYLLNHEIIARQTAGMALRVLRGEKPADIPVVEAQANVNMFDWRQLRRWGIDEDKLPPASILRNKPPSFWESYKWHVTGVISLLLLEALLIGVLLIERKGRVRAERLLIEQLAFETLISDLSARFVNVPPDRVNEEIERALKEVLNFSQVDRCSLSEFSADKTEILITHTCQAEGIRPAPARIDIDSPRAWIAGQLRSGASVIFKRLEELPPEAAIDKQYIGLRGIKSMAAIPLRASASVTYLITFSSIRAERDWPEAFISRLRLLGEIFVNALTRKQAEETLRESKERYRELAETTQAVPWEADAGTFQFAYVGPQSVALLGYPVEEWLAGDFWRSHLHPEDRERAVEFFSGTNALREDREFECRMVAADGSPVWVHNWFTKLRKNGGPERLRGVMLNVTERKRAEEEAQRHRDEMAQVARVTTMGELTASIAHEVNQPLCAILTNARVAGRLLAGEEPDVAEAREALGDIVTDSQRATEVINRVRAWVRRSEVTRVPLDVNEVIEGIMRWARNDLEKRGVSLELRLAGHPPLVMGDRIALQQVIFNLLRNAAEASGDQGHGRGRVEVSSSLPGGKTVTVSVRDDGVGIDPQNLERVFDAFFTTRENGMGMGLRISRTIIEAHDGRLWATRNADRGATFHFTLPIAAGAYAAGSGYHD